MTPISLMVAFGAALLVGPMVVYAFRGNASWAVGIASAIGLVLLQTSDANDLLRAFQPRSAIDWMPALCLAAIACVSIRQGSYRIGAAVGLALLVPIRLLWGSVYLQSDSIDPALVAVLGCWALSLSATLWCQENKQCGRMKWKVAAAWAITVAVVAITILMSGSFTYGAAVGVVGAALLGVLISAGQIPNVAAFPLIVLIGLSAAYAELSLGIAMALVAGLLGLVGSESLTAVRHAVLVRALALTVVLIAGGITASQFAIKINGPSNSFESYGGTTYDPPAAPDDDVLDSSDQPLIDNAGPIDPFSGFDIEP